MNLGFFINACKVMSVRLIEKWTPQYNYYYALFIKQEYEFEQVLNILDCLSQT